MPLSLELDALLDEEDGLRLPPEMMFGARPLDGHEPPSTVDSGDVDAKPKHRRSRSDPTEWLQSMRGSSARAVEEASSHKRSPSCEGSISPERKRHAPRWMGFDDDYELPKGSRVRRATPMPAPNAPPPTPAPSAPPTPPPAAPQAWSVPQALGPAVNETYVYNADIASYATPSRSPLSSPAQPRSVGDPQQAIACWGSPAG